MQEHHPEAHFSIRTMWPRQLRNFLHVSHADTLQVFDQLYAALPVQRAHTWFPMVYASALGMASGLAIDPNRDPVDATQWITAQYARFMLQRSVLQAMLEGCQRDLPAFMRVITHSTRLFTSVGRAHCVVEQPGEAVIEFQEHAAYWIESVIQGFWVGTLEELGLTGTVVYQRLNARHCTLRITWSPTAE